MHNGVAIEAGDRRLTLSNAVDRLRAALEAGDNALLHHVCQQAADFLGVIEVKVWRQPHAASSGPLGHDRDLFNDFRFGQGPRKGA